MGSYRDLVAAAKERITEIDSNSVDLEGITVVDVRERDEYEAGAIPGSILIPRGVLERDITTAAPDLDTPLLVHCAGGSRSALAAASLQEMGYTTVRSLAGGFEAWKQAGRVWGDPTGLTAEQRTRYSRHVRLPEVGEDGQLRLLGSSALIIGAGGLGSPAAIYLAAAGVGRIGIVDDDVVDQSNLQRQVLHNVERIGLRKTESARETLLALNPDVKVDTHDVRLDASNAAEMIGSYDVIIDAGDNFPTRYLVNDASLHSGVPVVHGSIFRFEGQVAVFNPWESACYRCLHREPPPPELAPSCAEAGVLGVLPGVIGSIQAMEALKLLLGIGDTLENRLLIYDALEQDFTSVAIARVTDCPACSDRSHPPAIVDYDETCRPPA